MVLKVALIILMMTVLAFVLLTSHRLFNKNVLTPNTEYPNSLLLFYCYLLHSLIRHPNLLSHIFWNEFKLDKHLNMF